MSAVRVFYDLSSTLYRLSGQAEHLFPNLVSPYSIYFEEPPTAKPYKFVAGSLENLKEILKQAILVWEAVKPERDLTKRNRTGRTFGITCGGLKNTSTIYHVKEYFLNRIGELAIKENIPLTDLNESHFRGGDRRSFD